MMSVFNLPVNDEVEQKINVPTYVKMSNINGVVSFETTTNKKEQVTLKELRKVFK